jgi:hypothetical protein
MQEQILKPTLPPDPCCTLVKIGMVQSGVRSDDVFVDLDETIINMQESLEIIIILLYEPFTYHS